MEALENLRQFIEEENQYAEPKNPANSMNDACRPSGARG